jgi:iron complex transport system permease protein
VTDRGRGAAALALGSCALLATLLLAPLFGSQHVDLGRALAGFGDPQSTDAFIFFKLRLPRVLCAMLVGGSLSLAGLSLQALTRNGLASEFTLGVASGGAFGAVLALRLGLAGTLWVFPASAGAALAGALVVALLVLGWSWRGGFDSGSLLLSGVTIGMICSAGILLVQYLADATQSHLMVRWLMGGLDVVGYRAVLGILPLLAAGALLIGLHAPELNQLLQGDELAQARGVAVRRVRGAVLAGVALLTGAAVSVAGPIGFVGLIVPHTLRLLAGLDHRRLAPLCAIWGAVFLALCDTVARSALPFGEMPVGILTALLGGPFFLWVLASRRRRITVL